MTNKKKETVDFNKVANKLILRYNFITTKETKELYIYKDGVYLPEGEDVVSFDLVNELKSKATKNTINEIINHIKILTVKSIDDIKQKNSNLICVNNGILNVETDELIKHNPEYVFFNKMPIDYDKDAECPTFESFLNDVVEDYEADQLQEFVGYTLMTDTAKYEKGLVLLGPGGNGKSTFLKIITAMFGETNVTAFTLQQLQDKVILVELFGKVANISMDIPKDKMLNVEHIKSITSGDRITGRGLFKGPLTFVPTCKLMFSCNSLPEPSSMNDNAFFSRWVIVDFNKDDFRKVDSSGLRKAIGDYDKIIMKEEASGVLNWALKGLKTVNMVQFSDVDVGEIKMKWLRNSNNVLSYISDNIIETFDKDFIYKRDIYADYVKYCRDNKEIAVSERAFHPKLKSLLAVEECHPTKGQTMQRPAWKGIKFIKEMQ